MENKQNPIRIDLTTEQQKQIKMTSNEDVKSLEITAEELEQRIAPRVALK